MVVEGVRAFEVIRVVEMVRAFEVIRVVEVVKVFMVVEVNMNREVEVVYRYEENFGLKSHNRNKGVGLGMTMPQAAGKKIGGKDASEYGTYRILMQSLIGDQCANKR